MTTKPLTDVAGIGPSTAKVLAEHGIKTAEDLANATAAQIVAVPGFSEARSMTGTSCCRSGNIEVPGSDGRGVSPVTGSRD